MNKLMLALLILFITLTFLDSVSTKLVVNKHGIEFEVNPTIVNGGSFLGIWILKIILLAIIVINFSFLYYRWHPVFRYINIYMFVYLIILFLVVVIGNFSIYYEDVGSIEPIPEEKRVEVYHKETSNYGQVMDLEPEVGGKQVAPYWVQMFINFIIFGLWYILERGDPKRR